MGTNFVILFPEHPGNNIDFMISHYFLILLIINVVLFLASSLGGFVDHHYSYGDQCGAHRRSKETWHVPLSLPTRKELCKGRQTAHDSIVSSFKFVCMYIRLLQVPYMDHLMVLDHPLLELSDLKLGV